jgi:hypothetical protein
MVGTGVSGGKRVRLTASAMPNKGCIFGSMAGLAPTVGLNPNLLNVYRKDTNYCQQKCLPFGCVDGWNYMKQNGLIACNKSAGGVGRAHWSPGIGVLFGGGCQKGPTY